MNTQHSEMNRTSRTSYTETLTLWDDQMDFATSSNAEIQENSYLCTLPGIFIMARILCFLVWTLITRTQYFQVPAFGWVMFVAVFYWVLTSLLFNHLQNNDLHQDFPGAMDHNGPLPSIYTLLPPLWMWERDNHNSTIWAASSFFASYSSNICPPILSITVVTICYSGNMYVSFPSWRSLTLQ
uniref:MARVEL domain-containing protein n=1 Tax=Monodelphis domestica TaxID=13616 RepID=A0A5F8GKL4_MONDO